MKKLIATMTILAVIASAVPTNAVAAAALAAEETVCVHADATAADKQYSIADIVGLWNWQDGTEFKPLTIFYNSTYNFDGQTGTVRKGTNSNPNGTTYISFDFYDKDGNFVMGFIEPEKKDGVIQEMYSGQDGKMHFVRDTGNAQQCLFPNEYGCYQVLELPDAKYSVKNLEGKWIGGQFEDEFKDCSELEGAFEFRNESGTMTGKVKLEAKLKADDTPEYFYNLYNDKNEQFLSFIITDQVTDTLTSSNGETYTRSGAKQSDPGETANATLAVPADLTGKWFYQPADGQTAGFVTVDENGHFCYLSAKQGELVEEASGSVTMHYDLTQDGTPVSLYRFATEDGEPFWQGVLNDEKNVFDLLHDGPAKMVRDESVRKASASDIFGSWILMTQEVTPDGTLGGYITQSVFTVKYNEEGGFCTYTRKDQETNAVTEGTVYATYQLNTDGYAQIWYTFYDSNGEIIFGFMDSTAEDRNTLWGGGFNMAKLEREKPVPNDYGYSDSAQNPLNIAYISELQGEWKCDDATLYITNASSSSGSFTMFSEEESATPTAYGTIKLQYHEADGKTEYQYVLYSGENIYLVFDANEVDSLNTLKTVDAKPITFVRSAVSYDAGDFLLYEIETVPANLSAAELNGKWRQNESANDTILTFKNCEKASGFFTLNTTEKDGSVSTVEGIVKLQYHYDASGNREYLYMLYVADQAGEYNQIYMTISALGETPLNELHLANNEYSFARMAVVTHKYSNEKLAEMAKTDYQQKTGILPADTKIIENAGGTVTIVMLDENGKELDAYTVNPDTGIGERFSNQSEVNLPQTGMSGIHKAFAGLAALMGITGIVLVKKSRKENEE